MNNYEEYCEDNYMSLAAAVIAQAIIDYRELVQYEITNFGHILTDEERLASTYEICQFGHVLNDRERHHEQWKDSYLTIPRIGLDAKDFLLSERFGDVYGAKLTGKYIVSAIEKIGLGNYFRTNIPHPEELRCGSDSYIHASNLSEICNAINDALYSNSLDRKELLNMIELSLSIQEGAWEE